MKKICSILLVAALFPLLGTAASSNEKNIRISRMSPVKSFVLKGKIKGQKAGWLRLSYLSVTGKYLQDSCAIKNGAFAFSGKIEVPTMAYLSGAVKGMDMDDPNFGYFFIEPAMMTVEVTAGDFKHLKIKGSATQDEQVVLDQVKAPITKALLPVSEVYKKANEAYMQARKEKKSAQELDALKEKASDIRDQFDPFNEQMDKIDLQYIKTHPDSFFAAYLLSYKVSSMPLDSSRAYYGPLSEKIKQSSYGKNILKEIKSLESGSPGSAASMFSVKDINGVQLDLASFKGQKYVLLDFWASWCVPCRKGNPHLIGLYNKYKEKGLEIVGVSDDDSNIAAWKKAVEQDHIGVWKHVLRGLKRKGNDFDKSEDITAPYGIHSLPTKILIDKNGMIVGRYGGGGESDEAMDKKLAEVFN